MLGPGYVMEAYDLNTFEIFQQFWKMECEFMCPLLEIFGGKIWKMRNCKFTSLSLMVPNFPILTIIAFYSLQAISTLTSLFYNSPITLAYINWICQWKKIPLEKIVLIFFGHPKVGNEHFSEILQFPFEGLAEMHNQIQNGLIGSAVYLVAQKGKVKSHFSRSCLLK